MPFWRKSLLHRKILQSTKTQPTKHVCVLWDSEVHTAVLLMIHILWCVVRRVVTDISKDRDSINFKGYAIRFSKRREPLTQRHNHMSQNRPESSVCSVPILCPLPEKLGVKMSELAFTIREQVSCLKSISCTVGRRSSLMWVHFVSGLLYLLIVVHSTSHLLHSFGVNSSRCELFYPRHSKSFGQGKAWDVTTHPPAFGEEKGGR